jgi:hypothetical protein
LSRHFTTATPAIYTTYHGSELGSLHLLSIHLLRHHLVHHHHLHGVAHHVSITVTVVVLGCRDMLDLDLGDLLFLDLDLDWLLLTTNQQGSSAQMILT